MESSGQNGEVRARLGIVERNQREVFERLRIVDRLDERMATVERGVARCDRNCEKIRAYVDAELERQEVETGERRKLRSGEKVAIIAAAGLILSSMVAAVASLISAGAFS